MDSSDEDLFVASAAIMMLFAAAYRKNKMKSKKPRKAIKPYLKQRENKGRFGDVSKCKCIVYMCYKYSCLLLVY